MKLANAHKGDKSKAEGAAPVLSGKDMQRMMQGGNELAAANTVFALSDMEKTLRDKILDRWQNTPALEMSLGYVDGLSRLLVSAKETNNKNNLKEFARRFRDIEELTGLKAPEKIGTDVDAAASALASLNEYIEREQIKPALPGALYAEFKKIESSLKKARTEIAKTAPKIPMPLD